jgi:hypothetical protein
MGALSLLYMALGLLLVQLAISAARSFASSLRTVPGPFLARLTDCWYLWTIRKGGFEVVNVGLHKQHGEWTARI